MSTNFNESFDNVTSEIRLSEILAMMQDEIGKALANIRWVINEGDRNGTLTTKQLNKLLKRRKRLNVRLDKLIDAQMNILDDHSRVKEITAKLAALTLATSNAAKEMKDTTIAIKKATRIIGFADQALGLITAMA